MCCTPSLLLVQEISTSLEECWLCALDENEDGGDDDSEIEACWLLGERTAEVDMHLRCQWLAVWSLLVCFDEHEHTPTHDLTHVSLCMCVLHVLRVRLC
eukprot:2989570-Alexandrium_andersonii.AAC.1